MNDALAGRHAQRWLTRRTAHRSPATCDTTMRGLALQLPPLQAQLLRYLFSFSMKPEGLTLDRVQAAAATGRGIDLGALQPRVPELLRTPSGKIVPAPPALLSDLPRARLAVAAERPGAKLNALLDIDARDPLSGNAVPSGATVTLTPL